MGIRLALAGDTMLGRKVGEAIAAGSFPFSADVVAAAREADLFVLNLECCISARGEPWPDLRKPFFFRAPPQAVEVLVALGVDAVTLANNHALDFGEEALEDTLDLLGGAGIATTGAGRDRDAARRPAVIAAAGTTVAVVGLADHPADFAATATSPGIAYADLRRATPAWVGEVISSVSCDMALVTPHWGPNMTAAPEPWVRRAAADLVAAGADLVAGHSAHVFHGARPPVLYDLGDFVDDYAVDSRLRNDLGLLWFVDLEGGAPTSVEALPLRLDYCVTRIADAADHDWVEARLRDACGEFGIAVVARGGRLVLAGWERS